MAQGGPGGLRHRQAAWAGGGALAQDRAGCVQPTRQLTTPPLRCLPRPAAEARRLLPAAEAERLAAQFEALQAALQPLLGGFRPVAY